MAEAKSVMETRRDQMFPQLAPQEVERLKRFGDIRHYPAGTLITQTGKVSDGLVFVLQGEIEVRQGGAVSRSSVITRHGPGSFHGELAQLSDRPSLVDAVAASDVEALVVPRRGCVTCWCRKPLWASASCGR